VDTELPLPTANSAIRWNGTADGLENFVLASQGAYVFPGGTGVLVQTAPLTAVARSVSSDPGIYTTNPDGVAGNIRVGLAVPMCQGRLSLSSTDPVPAGDQLAKTVVYLLPYKGGLITKYNTSLARWETVAIPGGESVGVPAVANKVYDVFSAGSGLSVVAWTNDTTRATALIAQDGAWRDSFGKLYVGSFRTTGVAGQTEDSAAKRYVWNYFNRIERHMLVQEASAPWAYTTDTFRQANGAATNQLDFVIGLDEDTISARVSAAAENGTTGVAMTVGIGIDSTTSDSSTLRSGCETDLTNIKESMSAEWVGRIGAVGRHTLVWLERSVATGTSTWTGTSNKIQSGIAGTVMA
jgi:hypothetical protein